MDLARIETSEDCVKLDLVSIFNADPRPTFVVDTVSVVATGDIALAYANPALQSRPDLLSCIDNGGLKHPDFCAWLSGTDVQGTYYRYGGALWYSYMVEARWNVISTLPSTSFVASTKKTMSTQSTPGHAPDCTHIPAEDYASYQVTISQLEKELRLLEFDKKQAAQQRAVCLQTVKSLRSQLQAHGGATKPVAHSTAPVETYSQDYIRDRTWQNNVDGLNGDMAASSNVLPTDTYHPRRASIAAATIPEQNSTTQVIQPMPEVPQPLGTIRVDSDASLALEKFQWLAEMVDVGFFDYHPSGKLVHANDSWYALSGHPRDPAAHTAHSFMTCVYPDDAEMVMDKWKTLLNGIPVTFEMRWKKQPELSDDPVRASDAQWVLSACVPVIGKDGVVQSISGCTTDINSQKHTAKVALERAEALERARASEERFARFASVAPIAIFRFDKHKNVEYCNDRWFEMTGIPKQRFEEITWPFGVADEDVAACARAWDNATVAKSIGNMEFRLRKEWHDTSGRRGQTWVYSTFFPEFGEDGSFNGLMGSMLDISHLKWAENMQKLRAEEALEAKRQQETFIDVVSHEMRNPLSAIVQCSDGIAANMSELQRLASASAHIRTAEQNERFQDHLESGQDAAQTILSCAAHQKRIVDDILTLSKLDSNLLLITPVKTQPVQMVRNVLKMYEMDCKKADVNVQLELSPSFTELEVDWLALDSSRVLQILINLLTNAIKFTRDQSVRTIVVSLSAASTPPSRHDTSIDYVPAEVITDAYGCGGEMGASEPIYLSFTVQDSGRGLNKEEKTKLFLKFSQASPKTHVQYGGSGLGLFISRKLTEMQGGEIGFASEAGVGSTFTFYVKTRRTEPPIKERDPFVQAAPTGTTDAVEAGKTKQLSVLLVEDNIVNQKVLGGQLRKMGFKVHLAGHGVEALDFLRTTELWSEPTSMERITLDVVLMDIEMPVMGGLECIRTIRQLEQSGKLHTHLPIISISANARQEQVDEAQQAGVNDTITKPFRISELMPKIQMLVQ